MNDKEALKVIERERLNTLVTLNQMEAARAELRAASLVQDEEQINLLREKLHVLLDKTIDSDLVLTNIIRLNPKP